MKNKQNKTKSVAFTVKYVTSNLGAKYIFIKTSVNVLEFRTFVVLQDKTRDAAMLGHYLLRRVRTPLCSQSCHPHRGNGLGRTCRGLPSGHCHTPQSADLAAQACPATNRDDIFYVFVLLWLLSLLDAMPSCVYSRVLGLSLPFSCVHLGLINPSIFFFVVRCYM